MDGDDALTRIGIGSAAIITGFAVGSVIQYLVKVVLARFLGPESYGVFILGFAVLQAAAMFALVGLHRSIPRFLSYYRGEGEESLMREAAATALYIVVPISLAVTAALYLSAPWLSIAAFSEPALVRPLRMLSLTILPLALFYLVIGFIRGLQNTRYKIYLDDLLLPGLDLLFILAFFAAGYGLMGAVYAYMAALAVTVVAGFRFYRRLSDDGFAGADGEMARRLMVFTWPLFVISLLVMASKWIDVLMMGWLLDSVQVGVYEVAFALAGLLSLFLSSLNYMFMPVISELYGRGRIGEILDIYRTSARWIFTLVLPLVAGMVIFPREILVILFGTSYAPGATALAILAVGYFYHVAIGPAGMVLLSLGRTRRFMAGMLVLALVDIGLNLALIPRYGMAGAAVAMTVALVAGNTILLAFAAREVGGYPYGRGHLVPAAGVLLAGGAILGLKHLVSPGLAGSVALGVVLVLVYAAVLYLGGGVQEEDRKMLAELLDAVNRS